MLPSIILPPLETEFSGIFFENVLQGTVFDWATSFWKELLENSVSFMQKGMWRGANKPKPRDLAMVGVLPAGQLVSRCVLIKPRSFAITLARLAREKTTQM